MKKKAAVDDDPLDHEIDFTRSLPNPYFLGVIGPERVRVLDADLLDAFPDSQSVNDALRQLLAQKPAKISARRVTSPKPRTRKVRT
ncbi:MAG: hypothetical protein JOZ54_14885 [Acidobacteria bacterium]|nr:hypothetical protein [Acidobacteriota bacterium]